MKRIGILYHRSDFDGILSMEACKHWLLKLHKEIELKMAGIDYGDNPSLPDWDFEALDQLYLVDFSVDSLLGDEKLRPRIVWIDHHKSALAKWAETDPARRIPGYRIDGVAACRLCWQWFAFHAQQTPERITLPTLGDFKERWVREPLLLTLAGEYDVWDQKRMEDDSRIERLQFGLRTLFDDDLSEFIAVQFDWEKAADPRGGDREYNLDEVIQRGRVAQAYAKKINDEYAKAHAHTIFWEQTCFCCLNLGLRGNSKLFSAALRPEHQACFGWRFDGKTKLCTISLYHAPGHEDIDLSKIAVKYGGGGHAGACGMQMSLTKLSHILLSNGGG